MRESLPPWFEQTARMSCACTEWLRDGAKRCALCGCASVPQVCVSPLVRAQSPGDASPVCSRFVPVSQADTCASLVASYNITSARLYTFNPGLNCAMFQQTAALLGNEVGHRIDTSIGL